MRGVETLGVVLAITIGLVIIALGVLMLGPMSPLRGRMLVQPQVALVARPLVSLVSPDSCGGESCRYDLELKSIALRSQGAPFDALVAVTYKGLEVLVPCPAAAAAQANGACRIDANGIGFDLAPTFEGSVWAMPPTLNATDRTDYTEGDGVIIDHQKVMVGNFSVTFHYLNLPILYDRARYAIECADDSRIVVQSDGESGRYTMCNGEIRITTIDIDSNPNRVCVNITTSGGKNRTDYDTVNVALWNTALLECANLSLSQNPVELDEDTALRCFNQRIMNWDFDVPVASWSGTTWTQPPCTFTWI